MKLKSIEYVEYEGEPQEWRLEPFSLEPINLLVGKNATGKSRTLNIIMGLANLLSGDWKPTLKSGTWKVKFSHENDAPEYEVEINESKVIRESFTIRGGKVLDRSEGGNGSIFAKKENKHIEFQTPESELAVVARRDSVQHPFFESLYEWGKTSRLYHFGTALGQRKYVISRDGDINGENLDTKNDELVVAIFNKGKQNHGDIFEEAIKEDMKRIGYQIAKVGLVQPTFNFALPAEAVGLFVQETTLACRTDQYSMSQGMFRALSIIIQLNYSYISGNPSLILIDDIGEGLDFERSSALIKLLVEKAKKSGVQLVMATNDRFVMNNVPLEMWSVLQREGGRCRVFNYENSKEKFDEFKFTGLNNFDFLATDFLNTESLPDA